MTSPFNSDTLLIWHFESGSPIKCVSLLIFKIASPSNFFNMTFWKWHPRLIIFQLSHAVSSLESLTWADSVSPPQAETQVLWWLGCCCDHWWAGIWSFLKKIIGQDIIMSTPTLWYLWWSPKLWALDLNYIRILSCELDGEYSLITNPESKCHELYYEDKMQTANIFSLVIWYLPETNNFQC